MRLAMCTLLLLAGGNAWAEEVSAEKFVTGTVNRARRALSVGPTVGGTLALATEPGEPEGTISFGIGAYLYKVPVFPTPGEISALIQERIKAKLAEHVRQVIASGGAQPTPSDLDSMAREIFEEVKAEILGERAVRAKTLEKPRLAFDLEGAYVVRAEGFQLRTTFGFGIKWVSLGATFVLQLDGGTALYAGPALDLRLLPGKGPRSPVVDLFLRYDFAVKDRDVRSDLLALGVRLLIDVI